MFDIYSPTTRKLLHLMLLSGAKTIEEVVRYIYGTDKFTIVDISKIGGKTVPYGSSYASVYLSAMNEHGANKANPTEFKANYAPNSSGTWATNNGKVALNRYTDIPLEKGHTVKIAITHGDNSDYGILSIRINKDGTAHSRRTDTTWPVVFVADNEDRALRCSIYRPDGTAMTEDEARSLDIVITTSDNTDFSWGYKKETTAYTIPALAGINDVYDSVERGDDLKWTKYTKIFGPTPAKTWAWYKYTERTDGKVVWGSRVTTVMPDTRNILCQYPVGTESQVLYGDDACCCVAGQIVLVFDPDFPNETDLDSFKAQLDKFAMELGNTQTTDATDRMYGIDYYDPTDTIERVSNPTITYSYNTAGLQTPLTPKQEIVKGNMYSDGSVYDNPSTTNWYAVFAHYFPAGLSTITFSYVIRLNRICINGRPVEINESVSTYTINIKEPAYITFAISETQSLEDLSLTITQPYAYMLKSDYRNIDAGTCSISQSVAPGIYTDNTIYRFTPPNNNMFPGDNTFYITGFTRSAIVASIITQVSQYGRDIDDFIYMVSNEYDYANIVSSKATVEELRTYLSGKIFHYKAKTRASVMDLTWNVEMFKNIHLEPNGSLNLYNSYNTDIPVVYTMANDKSFDFSACNMRWWNKIWYTTAGAVSASPDACATDFMPVMYFSTTSGKTRYMEFNITGIDYIYSRAIVFFDANFNFIERAYQTGQVLNYKTEVPANARYFRYQVSCGNTKGNMTQSYMDSYGITVQEYLE